MVARRRWATLTLVAGTAMALGGGGAAAQQALPLLSAEAPLGEYGITEATAVLRGRVSVAHTRDGLRLGIYFLRDTPPRSAPAEPPGPVPEHAAPPAPLATGGGAGVPRETARALWVWNTRELLADSAACGDFLGFVEGQGIRRVFLQLTPAEGARARAGFVPFDVDAMGTLVGRLSERGVEVDALDGDPAYALPGSRQGVLATVARVAEANARLPAGRRFHGVHYDVEPWLARGYQGPRREEILDGYVALVADVARAAHAAGLTAGFDVPFWLDAPDEETGEVPMARVDGKAGRILDQVLDLADEVTVMDYRTSAGGPDGSVAHALGELGAAAAAGTGARVFVGVEASPLVDEDLYTFGASPREGFPPGPGGPWIVLEPREGGRVRLWMVGSEEGRSELESRLTGRTDLRYWPAGSPVRIRADKQSFHALGAERMKLETDSLTRALSPYPAFAGLAFHDYVNLRALLEANHAPATSAGRTGTSPE